MDVIVSVIIPVYNTPLMYLDRCIKSVLDQTYNNIEVIIVDDGSEAECAADLDYWGKKDSRVNIYHIPNGGVSHARNYALNITKGEYVLFVDSDDLVNKYWLEWAVEIADKSQADAVFGTVQSIYKDSTFNINQHLQKKYYILNEELMWKLQCGQLIQGTKNNNPIFEMKVFGNWGKLFRRSIIGNQRFSEDLYYGEDQLFNHQIIRRFSKVIYNIDTCYYLTRDREGSATHLQDEKHQEAITLFLNRTKNVLPDNQNIINAFYINVLSKIDSTVNHMIYISDNSHLSLKKIYYILKKNLNIPIFHEAQELADLSVLKNGKGKLKLEFIKKNRIMLLSIWDWLRILKNRYINFNK